MDFKKIMRNALYNAIDQFPAENGINWTKYFEKDVEQFKIQFFIAIKPISNGRLLKK